MSFTHDILYHVDIRQCVCVHVHTMVRPYIACVVIIIIIIFSSGHSESEVALFETCLSYLSSLLDVSQ